MRELILNSLEEINIGTSKTNKLQYQLKYKITFPKYLKYYVTNSNPKSNATFRVFNNVINPKIIVITIIRTDQNKGWNDNLTIIPNIYTINYIEGFTDLDESQLVNNYNTYVYISRDILNKYNNKFLNWKTDFIKKYPNYYLYPIEGEIDSF